LSTLHEKFSTAKKHRGLASVEAVLIMPILLMLMYIMVQSAKTMVVYENRIVEARNAAYTVELYSGGEVRQLDEIRQSADETVQGIENGLVDAIAQANAGAEYLNLIGIDVGEVGDYVQHDHLSILQNFPIQRYAIVSDESTWFYDSMLDLTRDKMDDYSGTDDPDIMTDKIKGLYAILDNEHSKSGLTVGVSVSAYTGPLGVFAPFDGHFFMRNHHAADFATTLNLDDIHINDQAVIDKPYLLKAGYSKEMETMLNPEIIFNNLFADPDNQPLDLPGIFELPLPEPVDPTVGIVAGGTPDFASAEVQAGWDLYRNSGGTITNPDDWYNRIYNGTEDPADTGANINTGGSGSTLGNNLTRNGEPRLVYPNDWEPASLRGQVIPLQEAHHIIPHGHSRTIGTARRLVQWGIDINSELNGVWLPKSNVSTPPSPNPDGRTTHNVTFRHEYLDYINARFAAVTSPAQARAALAQIKRDLINGREDWGDVP